VGAELKEIVDLAQVDAVMLYLAVAAPVLGLLIGAIAGGVQGRLLTGLGRGLAFGMLGPIVLVMWRLYRYMVRYDPATGYVGLHKLSVFVLNVCIFAAVGIALGALYGKLIGGAGRRPAEEEENSAESVGS